jgi:hypothetical protein
VVIANPQPRTDSYGRTCRWQRSAAAGRILLDAKTVQLILLLNPETALSVDCVQALGSARRGGPRALFLHYQGPPLRLLQLLLLAELVTV